MKESHATKPIIDAKAPKDFKPKGMKTQITGRLAKRSYKAPKGKMGGPDKDVYLS